MEQRMLRSGSAFLLLLLLLVFVSFSGYVEAYKNYTVGDSLGWYDNLHEPSVNYQKWVAGKNFSLGDFLIFNTDNNHSVVQTYNFTTYKHCDYENALENDTYQWSATIPPPPTPWRDYDGWQCKHGQHFKLNVSHGQGLPPSLKDPADEALVQWPLILEMKETPPLTLWFRPTSMTPNRKMILTTHQGLLLCCHRSYTSWITNSVEF
ncbi:hypothetical protein AAG906_014407 [Vitis piasezkii]